MITRYRLLIGVLLPFYGSGAFADDGIPALLQFAEKYQESRPPAHAAPGKAATEAGPETKPAQDKAPARGPTEAKKSVAASVTAELKKTLRAQAAQLKAQQATIAKLEKQLAEVKQMPPTVHAPEASAPDLQRVSNLAKRVRQALAITPAETTAIEQLRQLHEREADISAQLATVKKDNARLQAQLRSLNRGGEGAEKAYQQALDKQKQLQDTLVGVKQMLGTREMALAEKEKALSAAQQALAGLQKTLQAKDAEKEKAVAAQTAAQQQLDSLTAGQAALRTQLTEQETAHKALSAQRDETERARQALDVQLTAERQRGEQLQTDIVALRERAKWLTAPQTLKTDSGSQAYAAGVSLGRDIQAMLEERKGWGVKTDPQTLLSGVIDTFSGQYQLTTDVLDKAMLAAERDAEQAREKAGQRQRIKGEDYLAGFKKQQGVKQSVAGFWYRVDHAGDTVIPASAIVDVVVKESLTDGTVIQDMDIGGKVLSQPLSAYPPLFREAIGHLKNHGSLTMVVPPSLAYGEAGYPPNVPPNATMVYVLRVEGVNVPNLK